jgi:hypothetical protein
MATAKTDHESQSHFPCVFRKAQNCGTKTYEDLSAPGRTTNIRPGHLTQILCTEVDCIVRTKVAMTVTFWYSSFPQTWSFPNRMLNVNVEDVFSQPWVSLKKMNVKETQG